MHRQKGAVEAEEKPDDKMGRSAGDQPDENIRIKMKQAVIRGSAKRAVMMLVLMLFLARQRDSGSDENGCGSVPLPRM